MDKMQKAQKGAEKITTMATKIFDIMSEFNYYDTEESDVTDVEENLIYDPYAIINSLTEIIDRLSNDLNIEREKVDFAISEATKKSKKDAETIERERENIDTMQHVIDILEEQKEQVDYEKVDELAEEIYYLMTEFTYRPYDELHQDLIYNTYSVMDSLIEIIKTLQTEEETTEVECDKENFFEVKVNGKLLTQEQLFQISVYYQACNNAWLLEQTYDVDHKDSLEMGYHIRHEMLNDEAYAKAISQELERKKTERIKQLHNTLADVYGELFNIADDDEIESELKFVKNAIRNHQDAEKELIGTERAWDI